jgi:hypothetical protein
MLIKIRRGLHGKKQINTNNNISEFNADFIYANMNKRPDMFKNYSEKIELKLG